MKTKTVFWGIFLITLGGLILINNFFPLNFNWELVWDFWPVILIIFGLYFLLRDSGIRWVFIILNALVLGLVLFAAIKSFSFWESEGDFGDSYQVEQFNAPLKDGIKRAKLTMEAAAGNFTIKDTTGNDLINARSEGSFGNYVFNHFDNNDNAEVSFEMQEHHVNIGRHFPKNRFEMKLNSRPVWDMDFNVGAASVNLDLAPYTLENLYIKSGAASVKVKLGDKAEKTDLKFDSGASSLEVYVPKNIGCEINADVKLSSKNFKGFNKIDNDTYRSENFDGASKRIYIAFDAGVSSVKVDRY
ncbi:MAG: LiaI-LiaF-like domain-containing protein [Bacillota bacterium]